MPELRRRAGCLLVSECGGFAQGHRPPEHADRRARGPQQPVPPDRAREQLLREQASPVVAERPELQPTGRGETRLQLLRPMIEAATD